MKKTTLTLIASLLTCSTLFSQASLADDHHDDRHQPWQQQNDHRQADNHDRDRNQNHPRDNHRHDEDKNRHDRERRSDRDHFAWQGHDFRRGHPIPQEYRGDRYRVANWHERGLPEPPRGEHWANIDGNYVLIAAATGVITSLVLGNAFN
ncbi:RcnB family protein [Pantoea sp. C2G6]|uniref:RcnB family protein n=1 Tax=Pantoea sp. C2G6 TaxID=3243084 RepID=UPI003ED91A7D